MSSRAEDPEVVSDAISEEILRIHRESYGQGAEWAHTYLDERFVVVVLDGLELLPNERFLVESGKEEAVAQVRSQYQRAIGPSFVAAVERATGRKVIGFASASSLEDPRFVVETFKLG